MNLFSLVLGLLLLQSAPFTVATPAPPPNTYTDPGMSFTAPAGFTQVPIPPHDPLHFDQPTVVAAFVKKSNAATPLVIQVEIQSYSGTLDNFKTLAESEARSNGANFVRDVAATTLSNGMPAIYEQYQLGSDLSDPVRYQYIWVDSQRGVELSLTAPALTISKQQAQAILANASAVRYPPPMP